VLSLTEDGGRRAGNMVPKPRCSSGGTEPALLPPRAGCTDLERPQFGMVVGW